MYWSQTMTRYSSGFAATKSRTKDRDECAEWGYNSRLDEFRPQCDLKMKQLGWTTRRRANAHRYIDGLSGVRDLRCHAISHTSTRLPHSLFVRNFETQSGSIFRISKSALVFIIQYRSICSPHCAIYQPEHARRSKLAKSKPPVHHNIELDDIDVVIGAIKEFFKS